MKTIKSEEIPQGTRQFLDSLDVSDEGVVIEEGGRRLALVPASFLEQLLEQRRQAKESLFRTIDQIRDRNRDGDSDQVLEDLEAIDHP